MIHLHFVSERERGIVGSDSSPLSVRTRNGVNDSNNYRAIALRCILGKIIENYIFHKYTDVIYSVHQTTSMCLKISEHYSAHIHCICSHSILFK